jgi:hypothetical protein
MTQAAAAPATGTGALAGQTVVVIGGSSGIAVHLMTSTALTGATFDVDGGQQLVPG